MDSATHSAERVLLTGATGFIGSHIGLALVEAGHDVIALRRRASNLWRCAAFSDRVRWLDLESADWAQAAINEQPTAVIHCAWTGVTAAQRDDWSLQLSNIPFLLALVEIAAAADARRFVAFGSQAEYGLVNGRVDEDHPCRPVTAYGAAKLACLAILEGFARQRALSYAWLRLFSIYGPLEDAQWFLPSLIRQFKANEPPQLTACEQRYDYLHVSDLAQGVLAALARPDRSGVFNVSSNISVPLRDVVNLIRQHTHAHVEPAFGALPYRPNQPMHLEGDSHRFYDAFAFRPTIDLWQGTRQVVEAASGLD